MIIVRDSADQAFQVWPTGQDLDHCWLAIAVKRGTRGSGHMWVAKAGAKQHLIRKQGCKVVWTNEVQ